jgi:hypothetical protein
MPMPLVLDFDGSIGALPDSVRLRLDAWQERIRFGCSMSTFADFSRNLDEMLPERYGTVFLGSGDFHHVSHALIARRGNGKAFNVVVLDNHPDNMRFPFGIHCGSWVRRVAALPCVRHVHVLGITSGDVSASHAWQNYFTPLLRGKLTNWCIGVDVRWAARLGLAGRFLGFDSAEELLDRFAESERANDVASYLTIDKDVLGEEVARTNWDQGKMREAEMLDAIALFRGRLVGSDITGDVSAYRYRTGWKRWMSAMDRQPDVGGTQLADWQRQQHCLNLRLLGAISACG